MIHPATQRQIEAADPRVSTWLSANAGSGKTRVLTDRVARLLLDGVDPQNILCLTYTKAAAAEMQNRLFRRLGEWAMRDAESLAAELRTLGVEGPFGADRLAEARRLFARAIETPGGLRIQTIHAFCASILRRFPLEAGLGPGFTEMEDRAAELLRLEVIDGLAETRPDLVAPFARLISGDDVADILAEISRNRALFALPHDARRIADMLGLPIGLSAADLVSQVVLPGTLDDLDALARACREGSTNDAKAADRIADALALTGLEQLAALEGILLSGEKAKEPFAPKIGTFPTKATRGLHADLCDRIDGLMQRVADARPLRQALITAEATAALHRFGSAYVAAYEARKAETGQLDFDDLILRTAQLLSDSHVAAWVLFRLDGGIDHILVDESQDTSPAQWVVVRKLAEEFSAGQGADPDRLRTLFVVGDLKQSIYSFQGADPRVFDESLHHFDTSFAAAGRPLNKLELEYSFRSATAVLRAVDQTFVGPVADGLGGALSHRAFKEDMPGRVDLWPALPKPEKKAADDREWFDPIDSVSPEHPVEKLARTIAERIEAMLETDTIPAENAQKQRIRRKVRPGDILILVPRRSGIFGPLIRSCKARGLPVAGADRLKLGGELAVKDIAAVLRFLSLPEDDLSLAAALKSPLFGWDEQQLFTLAQGRTGTLWQRLRETDCEARTILRDLRDRSDFLRPFDLVNRLLIRHDGRRRLLARLGPEAEDGIDSLLAQALAFEEAGVPSLTAFLEWMETGEVEVKRQMDSQGDQIRVMSVHGAKGLEAPIVILPDTAKRAVQLRGKVADMDGAPVWTPLKPDMPQALLDHRAELVRRQEEERRRLLYVAMTRAESWLIVCAAGETGTGMDSWHAMVADGIASDAVPLDTPTGEGLRLQTLDWDGLPLEEAAPEPGPVAALPELHPVIAPVASAPLSPSGLGGSKVLPGETDPEASEAALATGRILHHLLEFLPAVAPAERQETGLRLLENLEDAEGRIDGPELVADALRLIGSEVHRDLFAPGTLAEVGITGDAGGRRLSGVIDRLIVGDGFVMAVDYKTNRLVPSRPEEVPEGLLRQMGAYAHLLALVYPGREVRTALLWTATGALMVLPQNIVADAFTTAMAGLTAQ